MESPTSDSRGSRCMQWLRSTDFFLYYSHCLSAWGDRMWSFAVGLFLYKLSEGTLQLTATYSFVIGVSVLLMGSVVGNWIDNNPRLRVAQTSLIVQNSSVIISAIILCLIFSLETEINAYWDGWLMILMHILLIAIADVARLASMASSIAIQKDWIVVICKGDKDKLANLNAVLRRIDLLTNILAPVLVGQVMTFVSMLVGAIFIASWNIVSVFVEYYLLWKVYTRVPELAIKGQSSESGEEVEMQVMSGKDGSIENIAPCESAETTQDTGKVPQEQAVNEDISIPEGETTKTDDITAEIDDASKPLMKTSECMKSDKEMSVKEEKPQDDLPAGENLLTEDVDDAAIENTESSKCHRCTSLMCTSCVTLVSGWQIYMRQKVLFAGLGLASLYMTVLGFDTITSSYGYSQRLSESILGVFMGLGALTGICGTLAFPRIRQKFGLERTGLFSFSAEIVCLVMCVVSVWLPGSPFDLNYVEKDLNTTLCINMSTHVTTDGTVLTYLNNASSYVTVNATTSVYNDITTQEQLMECTKHNDTYSYASVAVLFTGIITARFGLWMVDLTVTQILQENVAESERGAVNGVQHALNSFMDVLKNFMVIIAPKPQTFGILIIISFCFVSLGGVLFAVYSRKIRGHLFHTEKLMKCGDCRHENGVPQNGHTISEPTV